MFDGARMPPRPLAQFAEPDRWMVRFGLPPANLWLSARMVGRPLTQVAAHGRVVVLGPSKPSRRDEAASPRVAVPQVA
jgi:hypothetical protein